MSATRGYTLLEMLVCLSVISLLTLLSIRRMDSPDLEKYRFLNDYLLMQARCMKEKAASMYEKGISFNSMGHVDMGRTIDFSNGQVIVHLGNGYATLR